MKISWRRFIFNIIFEALRPFFDFKKASMKAVEFTTQIINNLIQVPLEFDSEINSVKHKNIRVILLIDERGDYEENRIKSVVQEQFFKGYSESDAIYDE